MVNPPAESLAALTGARKWPPLDAAIGPIALCPSPTVMMLR